MRRILAGCLLLLVSTNIQAEDPAKKETGKSARERLASIRKQRQDARRAYSTAYSRAKTPKEKSKAFTKYYPKSATYAKLFLKLAKDHPKDPVAVTSLIEVIGAARQGKMLTDALGILTKQHFDNKQMGSVCQRLVYSPSAETEKFMRLVLAKNPHRQAKAYACYALGRYRKRMSTMAKALKDNPDRIRTYKGFYGAEFVHKLTTVEPAEIQKESEELFVRVVNEFGNVGSKRRPLGKVAERELFEIRNLAIGKVAPEVKGEDIDGVKFKLSDYRGKVVVIDFWGDW